MPDHNKILSIELMAKVLEVNPDPVLLMSIDGNVLYFNSATQKYLDYIHSKISNREVTLLLPENINNILIDMSNNQVEIKRIDYEVLDTFVKCKIVNSVEDNIFHIYINNTTSVNHVAYYDLVTQLPNAVYLNKIIDEEIIKSKKSGVCFSILKLNIINYKNLSYALGYQFGEKLLCAVADKLKNIFNSDEIIAKFSDHDYVILLQQVTLRSAKVCADNVIEVFENPLIISELRIEVEVCVGIAEYPKHGGDSHAIMQCSDIAMHKAMKMNSAIESYDKKFFDLTTRKIKLATELHQALVSNELSVVYQPKVNIRSNSVVGVEVLMRWQHPTEGFISPDIFIEVAEQSRLIKEITIWVLNNSLKNYSKLASVLPNIQLSVNITAKDLSSESFPEIVAGLLAAWNVPANILILEITENALIVDTEHVLSIISRLSNIGVKLSIDDFGTGYSSLNYLRQLNVNELKIDRSFVMDMMEDENDKIIVRAVTSLAHDLNLIVTAEGVENEGSLRELKKYKCDIAQGYYFSKPLNMDDILQWIKEFSNSN